MNNKTVVGVLLSWAFIIGGFYLYDKNITPVEPVQEETVAALGQKILSKGGFITPLEVISDSRCPVDVVCIWAGEVTLKTRLEKDAVSQEVVLKLQTPTTFQGSTVSLVNVTPENNSKKLYEKEDYRFTFLVTPPKSDDKSDLIRLKTPLSNQTVTSPLVIKGEARGYWFFEASFPVFLTNWDGLIIAQGIATAKSDPANPDGVNWMTEDFVPFEATLNFTVDPNVYSNRGSLILKKDNPSGLPEHDDALEIPVVIE